jgi:hypothetical protein
MFRALVPLAYDYSISILIPCIESFYFNIVDDSEKEGSKLRSAEVSDSASHRNFSSTGITKAPLRRKFKATHWLQERWDQEDLVGRLKGTLLRHHNPQILEVADAISQELQEMPVVFCNSYLF